MRPGVTILPRIPELSIASLSSIEYGTSIEANAGVPESEPSFDINFIRPRTKYIPRHFGRTSSWNHALSVLDGNSAIPLCIFSRNAGISLPYGGLSHTLSSPQSTLRPFSSLVTIRSAVAYGIASAAQGSRSKRPSDSTIHLGVIQVCSPDVLSKLLIVFYYFLLRSSSVISVPLSASIVQTLRSIVRPTFSSTVSRAMIIFCVASVPPTRLMRPRPWRNSAES